MLDAAERVRLIRQKEAAAAVVDLRRNRMRPTVRTLTFALVPPVPPRTIFRLPRAITLRARVPPSASCSSSTSSSEYATRTPPRRTTTPPRNANPTRVTFQQVLASIRGALFPDPIPPLGRGSGSVDRGKTRTERALLDALLVAGVDLDDVGGFSVRGRDGGRKGRARARAVRFRL
ncbi:hypothetical protein C8F04DRAFT_218526 [Mycena alexandri]|uniref:Uncharacterized protein n=1 Tax=Mycena alexandri TaxID=1745969 RepID=A0AAD6XGC4_9AGAR|nr:hypothetical protein C8F04DRAFT_218526 [Mycena alexandri]